MFVNIQLFYLKKGTELTLSVFKRALLWEIIFFPPCFRFSFNNLFPPDPVQATYVARAESNSGLGLLSWFRRRSFFHAAQLYSKGEKWKYIINRHHYLTFMCLVQFVWSSPPKSTLVHRHYSRLHDLGAKNGRADLNSISHFELI